MVRRTNAVPAAAIVAAVLVAGAGLIAVAAQQRPEPQRPTRDTPAQQGQPTATPALTGRITGRVLDAVNGRPIRLARVMLNAPDVGGRGAQTDEGGVFDFTDLPAGRYMLTVSKPGYIGLSFGQRRPLQPGTPLQLEAGQQLKGVDFRLPRGGVIAGVVYDEVGDPMPGMMVRVMRFQYAQGARQLMPAGGGQTDDRGAYRVWGLNPGEYYVSAVAPNLTFGGGRGGGRGGRGAGGPLPGLPGPAGPGGRAEILAQAGAAVDDADVGYAPTYFPGVASVFEATPVNLGLSAEALDVNFNVLLVRTAQVAGRAVNADGTPVTAGNLTLSADGPVGRGGPGVNFGNRIQWDGAFSIANVPPGRYVVRARGTDDAAPQYAALPLTVAGEDLTDVIVTLAPGATLSGTVSFEITQSVVPPDVTQVRVSPQPADSTAFGIRANSRVEKDGRFTLDGIPLGPHWIRAEAPRGWMLKSVLVDGHEAIDTPLVVRSGQKIAGVSLVFTDKLSEINGMVTDGQGRPMTEFTVLAFPTDSDQWRPQARQIMTARPDQNGKFQLRGLPAGDYFLTTIDPEQPGEWFEPAFLEQHRSDAAHITLADGDIKTHDFKLAR